MSASKQEEAKHQHTPYCTRTPTRLKYRKFANYRGSEEWLRMRRERRGGGEGKRAKSERKIIILYDEMKADGVISFQSLDSAYFSASFCAMSIFLFSLQLVFSRDFILPFKSNSSFGFAHSQREVALYACILYNMRTQNCILFCIRFFRRSDFSGRLECINRSSLSIAAIINDDSING